MKKIEDLKRDILEGKLEHFYVFYGEDYGIRKHYIDKIKTFFKSKPTYAENYEGIKFGSRSVSLFGNNNQLVIVYDDVEFANLKAKEIQQFINNLSTYTVIFVYEDALESSTLFKEFDQYITNFPVVQDNIALEFVTDELLNEKKINDFSIYENIKLKCSVMNQLFVDHTLDKSGIHISFKDDNDKIPTAFPVIFSSI